MKVLVTGGAGFIGSFLTDALVEAGFPVVVLDNLDRQVHPTGKWPEYRNPHAEYVEGDVRDAELLRRILRSVDTIFHQAAAVGVAQSQVEVERYVSVNVTGTAALYQAILDSHAEIRGIIVAGSMSTYGEGAYRCPACGPVTPSVRDPKHLGPGKWEHTCPTCGHDLVPLPTNESHPCRPASIYALTKKAQEDIAINMAVTYGFPTVVLRYFNGYGPRQALSNPYTGVLAIFINRLLNSRAPLVYEDGRQLRDFVSVRDIARANLLAMEAKLDGAHVMNIGSGQRLTVLDVAHSLAAGLGVDVQPAVPGKFRIGDIRHCFADVSKAKALLAYAPQQALEDRIAELIEWARPRKAADGVEAMVATFESARVIK